MASFPGQKGTGSPLPNPPLNLSVTGTTTSSVSLSWSAPVGGATTYNLFRNGTRVQTGISGTSTTDTGLTASTAYTYYVTSQKTIGEGSRSNQVTGSTGAVPNAPQSLAVINTTISTVSLSWAAPVGGATTYNLYRNGAKVQSSISSLSTTDTGLSPSTGYTYNVTGTNSFGEGPQSNSVLGTTASSSHSVKWNPGHWTEFDTKLTGVAVAGRNLSGITTEVDFMSGLANVQGYMIGVSWSNLQIAAGTAASSFTWTNLDTIINYIKAAGKRYCIQVIAGDFSNTHPNGSTAYLPAFLQNGNTALYGTAGYRVAGVTTVVAGASGWWGGDGNGNTYGAALWRPNVMAEWINLHVAIGHRYDSDPAFEAIWQGEDSFYAGTGADNNSDYNDTTMLNNWKNFLNAECGVGGVPGAFPTTNVGFSETFLQFQNNSIALTNYITNGVFTSHPPILGQTDSLGAVQRSAIHTWGTQTYTGALGTLGDRRSTRRFMAEIQAPDIGIFVNLGSAREDIKAGLDIMACTHAFWAICPRPLAASTKPGSYPIVFSPAANGTSATLSTPWPLTSGVYDLNTSGSIKMTATKGSSAVTFNTTVTASTSNVRLPMVPFNWFNGGTATATDNGTTNSYTDPGLGTYINNVANALATTGYPTDYP